MTQRGTKRQWADLSARERTVVVLLGALQLTLSGAAWADLATRPANQVNGRKRTWAWVIAINFVGPVAYFRRGRR